MESTEDLDTNSNHYNRYRDYQKDLDELEEINDNQRTGDDNNRPSTPAPTPGTNVDNNGNRGTGNGGINTPTPVEPLVEEEDGDTIVNNPSNPAGEWGGPPD